MIEITAQIIGSGPRGEQGIQGEQGVQGIQGIQGIKGDNGDRGDDGTTPTKGVDYFTAAEQDLFQQRTDEITGKAYRTGVSNGVIFMEEV